MLPFQNLGLGQGGFKSIHNIFLGKSGFMDVVEMPICCLADNWRPVCVA
jgi:hypothetical protein